MIELGIYSNAVFLMTELLREGESGAQSRQRGYRELFQTEMAPTLLSFLRGIPIFR